MKPFQDSDLAAGLLGSLFMLVWYFVLGQNVPIGIVLSFVIYFIARWVVLTLPKKRMRNTFADAQRRLASLRNLAQNIQDKEIQQMVRTIDSDIDRIIGLAYRRKSHLDIAQHVVDMYLDSTIQLLRRYQELQMGGVQSADEVIAEVRQVLPAIHEQLSRTWDDMHRDEVLELQQQTDRLRALLDTNATVTMGVASAAPAPAATAEQWQAPASSPPAVAPPPPMAPPPMTSPPTPGAGPASPAPPTMAPPPSPPPPSTPYGGETTHDDRPGPI